MKSLKSKIEDLEKQIGNTPMVTLGNGIYGKLESKNLAGSIKDRVAFYMIKNAVESGELKENGTVVEATSGNTGIGLAYVASKLGFKTILTMPENMSKERKQMLKFYGAELVLTDINKGMIGSVEKAKEIVKTQNGFFANQFGNKSSIQAHFETTAPEIFGEFDDIKYIVCCVGSGGTAMGIKKYILQNGIDCKLIAVEPEESPLMSKGFAGSHQIQGIGANFIPELVDVCCFDEIRTVKSEDAINATKQLYQEYGLKCGISSGAAYYVSKKLNQEIEGKIVAILPDGGDRYSDSLYI